MTAAHLVVLRISFCKRFEPFGNGAINAFCIVLYCIVLSGHRKSTGGVGTENPLVDQVQIIYSISL